LKVFNLNTAPPKRIRLHSTVLQAIDGTGTSNGTGTGTDPNQAIYEVVAETSPDWEFLTDRAGHYRFIAESCKKICGFSREAFLSSPDFFLSIIHPEDRTRWTTSWNQVLQGKGKGKINEKTFEFRILHKNGTIRWMEQQMVRLMDENNQFAGIRGVNRDVTRRRMSELEFKKLHKGIQNSPASIVITDLVGNIEYVNPKFTQITGYEFSEVVGKRPSMFKSGFTSHEDYGKIWDVILSGKQWNGEFRNRKKNGELYWESTMIAPITDSDGKISNFIAVKEDITQRKVAEQELQEILHTVSDQNRRLLEFNYITSHNIRSHASNIAAITDQLRDSNDNNSREELVDMLVTVSANLLGTLEHLNTNLRVQREVNIRRENLNLRSFVKHALEMIYLESSFAVRERPILISNDVPEDFKILANANYVENVLMNLIHNAIRYRHPDRNAQILITATQLEDFSEFSIKDNGLGIDLVRHRNRIFGMGQVFHENPEARGMGLFVVKNQVEAMGGSIEVVSEPDKGSTFIVRIPNKLSLTDQHLYINEASVEPIRRASLAPDLLNVLR
jgi:PAS domain S-box-containing protein